MKSSAKKGAENNREISAQISTLHQRLYQAINLGLRCHNDRGWKWQCTDIEIQRLVVRSIDAFLDCISSETSNHPLVKDSVADLVGALDFILQFKNESILRLASNVAIKMVNVLPNSILQAHELDLVRPLSSLLSSHQLQVSVSCAAALSSILVNLISKREKEVWEIFRETNTVINLIRNIQDFPDGNKPDEYLQEMVSLLSQILCQWPASRFSVWNDAKLMEALDSISLKADFSVKVVVMQLYSSIALCSNGAKKLLEDGETLLQIMVDCMNSSNSLSFQLEGFKLAQCFAISEQGCLKMIKMSCEPLIKAIIGGMSHWSLQSGKLVKGQMSLLLEVCRLCMVITRWAGEHHTYFWKLGVDRVLLALLLNNFHKTHQPRNFSSLKEQIAIAQEGLKLDLLPVLRPYIWDILGCLAAHCAEDLDPKKHGNEVTFNLLITCACLTFVDSIRTSRQICQNDIATRFGNESASRAVLLMIYSPCKYIASQARFVLSEILKPNGKEDLKYIFNTLDATSSGDKFRMPDNVQIVVNLMTLACYSGLPQYRRHLIESQGIKTLLAFIRWWLSSRVCIRRLSVALHLHNFFNKRTCCYDYAEDWEGEDMLLLFSLWGLAELIHHSGSVENQAGVFASQIDYSEAELISLLQGICSGPYATGPRWYAAYILSCFGLYGFPSKLGKRIGKALDENEHTDLKLILANQEYLRVHGVIVMVRCPSLLPPGELPHNEKTSNNSTTEVRLSAHVDHQALLKLLEFVYSGYLQAGEDLVKKLKVFARHCNLQPLLQMFHKKSPKWSTPFPRFDLAVALGPAGHHFSDVILEAKANEQMQWACNICSLSVPHMHVHKVVLCSSCDYLRALFQSGMQESRSRSIEVPVSWEALRIIVNWFYSDKLPTPVWGCLWNNLDAEEKIQQLRPYIELCWLSQFWLLGDLRKDCVRVIIPRLDSGTDLSIKILQIAAEFSMWKLAELAANFLAPSYQRLRNSGELEALDEDLVDLIRAASVRLSREAGARGASVRLSREGGGRRRS